VWSIRATLGQWVSLASEETNLPLTMSGAHSTEAGNPMLIKTTTGEVKGKSPTYWKGFNEDEVDR